MSSREAFEAAWRKEYPLHSLSVFMRSGLNPEAYAGTRVNDGWLMWQASERQTLQWLLNLCEIAKDKEALRATLRVMLDASSEKEGS